ncbi:MAG: hypothetical protein ACR652_10870 [Methylocystis sp.]|uniref:hypothetical protein n=1 Tax=Methylocystis sp. TaxID=1911079 RepID=UPI003DA69929
MKAIEFTVNTQVWPCLYAAGEIASFEDSVADHLVRTGRAKFNKTLFNRVAEMVAPKKASAERSGKGED